MFIVVDLGPSHWATSSGSVQARNTFAGGASNSRVIVIVGRFGSASMVASRFVVLFMMLLLFR